MVRPRLGEVPIHRLGHARLVRDLLRASLPPGSRVLLTLVGGGFGVQVYHRSPDHGQCSTSVSGVPVKVCPSPVPRPRR